MKVSAWLVIELKDHPYYYGKIEPRIVKALQNRPKNQMAVKVTLEFEEEDLQPHVERLIDSGHVSLMIEEPEEDVE